MTTTKGQMHKVNLDIRRSLVGAFTGLVLASVLVSGCASSGALRLGDQAATTGDWDTAVAHFRTALQENPGDARARIGLERAMHRAAAVHVERARELPRTP